MKKLLLLITLVSQVLILNNAHADRIDQQLNQKKSKVKRICADDIRCGEGYRLCARNLYNTANRMQRNWSSFDDTQCSKFMRNLKAKELFQVSCRRIVRSTANLLRICWRSNSYGCTERVKRNLYPEVKRDCGQKIVNNCIRLCTRRFSTGCYSSCRKMIQ